MQKVIWMLVGTLLTFGTAQAELLPLDAAQRAGLQSWLDAHKGYRIARDADCNCANDLIEIRTKLEGVWKARPGYRPYFLMADFRKNGQADFAVVVVRRDIMKPREGVLLIFDGPVAASGEKPAYVGKVAPLQGAGLGIPPGNTWPVYGRNFSEGCIYRPWRRTYRENCRQNYY